jgi:hypothetical protein
VECTGIYFALMLSFYWRIDMTDNCIDTGSKEISNKHVCFSNFFKDEYKLEAAGTSEVRDNNGKVVGMEGHGPRLMKRQVLHCSMCGLISKTEWEEAVYED